jgi:hypothetical protein
MWLHLKLMMLRSLNEAGLQEVITILLSWLNSLLFAEDRYDKFIEILCFFTFILLMSLHLLVLSEESLHGCRPGLNLNLGHALGAGRLANN